MLQIEKPKINLDTSKETKLRDRCTLLNKQLKALKEKLRRRLVTIAKIEAEKKEVTENHLRTIELLKSGDSRDINFEDILHEAVVKLS